MPSLIYPAGRNPGFSPSHPMAAGTLISAVKVGALQSSATVGAPVVDLLSGTMATGGANVVGLGLDPVIGPYTNAVNAANNSRFVVSSNGRLSGGPNPVTLGVIFSITSTTSAIIMGSGSGSTGWRIDISTVVALVSNGVVNTGNSFTIAANTPYFLAMSANATKVNSVLMNLATGQLSTDTKSPAGNTAGNLISTDFFYLGNNTAHKVSSGMIANSFHSLNELVAWAQDPWAYWYPSIQRRVGVAAGVSFIPAWARNSNLPVIGTGTY